MAIHPIADEVAANALVNVLGSNRWHPVALAHGYLLMIHGASDETVVQKIRSYSDITRRSAKEWLEEAKIKGFLSL